MMSLLKQLKKFRSKRFRIWWIVMAVAVITIGIILVVHYQDLQVSYEPSSLQLTTESGQSSLLTRLLGLEEDAAAIAKATTEQLLKAEREKAESRHIQLHTELAELALKLDDAKSQIKILADERDQLKEEIRQNNLLINKLSLSPSTTETVATATSSSTAAPTCEAGKEYSEVCRICMRTERDPKLEKLAFVHVPDSAGSSFTVAMRSFFGCQPAGVGCWGSPETVNGDVDCGGHIYGCYGNLPFTQRHSVAMFREPLSRLRAAYYNSRHVPGADRDNKAAASRTFSLTDFAKIPAAVDVATKMMVGLLPGDARPMEPSLVLTAISNLKSLDFIGIAEHFNSSVCLFYLTFGGVPQPWDFAQAKVSRAYFHDRPIPEVEAAELRPLLAGDIDVYNAALELFLAKAKYFSFQLVD